MCIGLDVCIVVLTCVLRYVRVHSGLDVCIVVWTCVLRYVRVHSGLDVCIVGFESWSVRWRI